MLTCYHVLMRLEFGTSGASVCVCVCVCVCLRCPFVFRSSESSCCRTADGLLSSCHDFLAAVSARSPASGDAQLALGAPLPPLVAVVGPEGAGGSGYGTVPSLEQGAAGSVSEGEIVGGPSSAPPGTAGRGGPGGPPGRARDLGPGTALFLAPLSVPLPLQEHRVANHGVPLLRFVVDALSTAFRRGCRVLMAEATVAMHENRWLGLPQGFHVLRTVRAALSLHIPRRDSVATTASRAFVARGARACEVAGWPPPPAPLGPASFLVCPHCYFQLDVKSFADHVGTGPKGCARKGATLLVARGPEQEDWERSLSPPPGVPQAAAELLYPILAATVTTYFRSGLPTIRGKPLLDDVSEFCVRVFLMTPAQVDSLLCGGSAASFDSFDGVCPTLCSLLDELDPAGWSLRQVITKARSACLPRISKGKVVVGSVAGVADLVLSNCIASALEVRVHMERVYNLLKVGSSSQSSDPSCSTLLPCADWGDLTIHISRASAPALQSLQSAYRTWVAVRRGYTSRTGCEPSAEFDNGLFRGVVLALQRQGGGGEDRDVGEEKDGEDQEGEDQDGSGSSGLGVPALLSFLNPKETHVQRLTRIHGPPSALRFDLSTIQLLFPRARVRPDSKRDLNT